MDCHGLGERNERGDNLINFARAHSLFIANSMFKKKLHKRWTWTLGAGRNEIDYILTDKSHKLLIQDVGVVNGFSYSSDHRMIRAKLKISGVNRSSKRKFFQNSGRISVEEYLDKVKLFHSKYDLLSSMGMNNDYTKFVMNLQECCNLFTTKNNQQSIISHATREAIKKREDLRRRTNLDPTLNDEFKRTRKIAHRLIKRDVHLNDLNELNNAIKNAKSLKKAREGINFKNKKWIPFLKDEKGIMKSSRNEVLEIATKFYEKLFQSTLTVNETSDLNPDLSNYDDVPDITVDEIQSALQEMKNNKSLGDDNIPIDVLKIANIKCMNDISNIFNYILKNEKIPDDWLKSTIILLYKKGDKSEINNYRPISSIPHLYKLFMKIILNRLQDKMDEYQSVDQAGFRKHYSTTDHLFSQPID